LYSNWCTFASLVLLLNFKFTCHLFFFFYPKVWFVSLIVCLFC
jgi:hypothetical protein